MKTFKELKSLLELASRHDIEMDWKQSTAQQIFNNRQKSSQSIDQFVQDISKIAKVSGTGTNQEFEFKDGSVLVRHGDGFEVK